MMTTTTRAAGCGRRACAAVGLGAAALAVALVSMAPAAGAHPLGNYTINHYSGVLVSPSVLRVDHVVDLAEIPTIQERPIVDADRDGAISGAEAAGYAASACAERADALDLRVDGKRLELTVTGASVTFPAGVGGLDTLRLECALDAVPAAALQSGRHTFAFTDADRAERIGWREITLTGFGVELDPVTMVPASSVSDRLRAYPDAAQTEPLRVTAIEAGLDVVDAAAVAPALGQTGTATPVRRDAPSDPLTDLVGRADQGLAPALVALGFAAVLGALHGLAPGHGKTVVAAFLVGSRGTRRQALGLAMAVALSHTVGVFVLGGVTLAVSTAFPLERVYGWLQLGSATLIFGLGCWLTLHLVRARRASRVPSSPPRRGLVSVGAAVRGDLAPLEENDHDGLPSHRHPHDHAHGHDHGHDHAHHGHDHDRPGHEHHGHRHGLFGHRHRVDWERVDVDNPLGWRALVALGLSGGMVPSASAVIVLLGAVQVGRLPFGAALIMAFGVGLSAALVGVGLGVVAISRRTQRHLDTRGIGRRLTALTRPLAAAALLLVGAWLASRALGRI